jgi:2-keto-4-pentenoate hydratase
MQPLSPIAILKAYDHVSALDPQQFHSINDFKLAQRIAKDVVQLRVARGEKPLGYKIGFTNRSIWPVYGVSRPIWSPIYDTTVTHLPGDHVQIGLGRFVEPRLEPEIVIGLKAAPHDDSLAAIREAISWVAHGFEIVQSHFPAWKFTAAQAHACQGLHGALLIGTKTYIEPGAQGLAGTLSEGSAKSAISCNNPGLPDLEFVEEGVGANVLDGPLQALAFLVRGLKEEGGALAAGDIITTGTLTDAKPMVSGQSWRSFWLARSMQTSASSANQERSATTAQLKETMHHSYFLSNLALDVV